MKSIGEAATPAAEYRASVDAVIGALRDMQRPFEAAIATLQRIRGLRITSPELLAEGTSTCRKVAVGLRYYLQESQGTPASVAEGLLRLERTLVEVLEKENR